MDRPQLAGPLFGNMPRALSLLATLLAIASPSEAVESWLTRSAMQQAFEGRTLSGKYSNGVGFTETYAGNGHISYSDAFNSDTGNWHVTAQGFCTFYDNLSGGCFQVKIHGSNCFDFYISERQDGGPVAPDGAPVLIAQGWYKDVPPTCEALSS